MPALTDEGMVLARQEMFFLCDEMSRLNPAAPQQLLEKIEQGKINGMTYAIVKRPGYGLCGCFYGWAGSLTGYDYEVLYNIVGDVMLERLGLFFSEHPLEELAFLAPTCQIPDYVRMNDMAYAATWVKEWLSEHHSVGQ